MCHPYPDHVPVLAIARPSVVASKDSVHRRVANYDRNMIRTKKTNMALVQALQAIPKVGYLVDCSSHEHILKTSSCNAFEDFCSKGAPPPPNPILGQQTFELGTIRRRYENGLNYGGWEIICDAARWCLGRWNYAVKRG